VKFKIGDIIEFKDAAFRSAPKEFELTGANYVGRIDAIIKNIGPLRKGDHEFELWMEYYGEMNGRLYVWPDLVIRTIEDGHTAFPKELNPPLKLGTMVTFVDDKKNHLDEIEGYEYYFSGDEDRWQYKMKYSGFLMGTDEFEVKK